MIHGLARAGSGQSSVAAREATGASFLERSFEALEADDPILASLLEREHRRQQETLSLVAAASAAPPSALACQAFTAGNVTAEGYPGARFHGGCDVVDDVERLAVDRARTAFRAAYANVQPHSATSANQVVIFSLLDAGDTILSLALEAGGHLSHGGRASVTSKFFDIVSYGVTADGLIDYEGAEQLARRVRPKLIVVGGSSYPRIPDFDRFRAIADSVGAVLLADISHVAGLVVAALHPSPIDVAHVTTTSTYKQLYGPRGGLVLLGQDHAWVSPGGTSLERLVQRGVFPFFQGTPNMATIASKARALDFVAQPAFRSLARRIVAGARTLAERLAERGHTLVTGGTDTHLIVVDLRAAGITGAAAQAALESCGIVLNKNLVPGDPRPPASTSGLRIGTNVAALRGFGDAEFEQAADLIDDVLSALEPGAEGDAYVLDDAVRDRVSAAVRALCAANPTPGYA
jgi:glycine hydroxymethyltransferase